ncbi:hypothetical protein N8077_00140 [Myxococcota bacterium]|nr:hypothetical protein [Myxococcota bacterium]
MDSRNAGKRFAFGRYEMSRPLGFTPRATDVNTRLTGQRFLTPLYQVCSVSMFRDFAWRDALRSMYRLDLFPLA